ncbi:DMT family transporter [Stappia sp.]|uniref:DMT family transporter n=1 Tax=Stappia sp. TaxID=1870903 RepID=UPI0032D96313
MLTFLDRFAPGIFVLLWSTGFIGSKLGSPYIEPFVFLTIRFALVLPLLWLLLLVTGARWPREASAIGHCLVAGALIHGVYLGGIFFAIDRGMPAGIAALVLGLQPLLTALLAGPILGERVSPRHWAGLAVGGVGLALVVAPRIGVDASGLTAVTAGVCLLAVAGMAIGTVYQKRFAGGIDLLAGTALQYIGALLVVVPLTFWESWEIVWARDLVIAMTWLVLVLSIGAILLLMVLIRRGSAARVASLFYLVPVAAAVESYFLFGETLSPIQIVGSALVVGALLLIRERRIGTRRTPA